MKKSTIIIIAFIIVQSASLSAQTDQLFMDVQYVDSTLTIHANYTTQVKEKTNSLYFLLNPGFSISNISAPGLDTFQLSQKPDRPFPYWKLSFQETIAEGQKIDIQFNYQVDLANQNHMRSNWIELNVDKLWFPNRDIDNEFTYNVTLLDFPKDYSLVSSTDTKIDYSQPGIIRLKKSTPDKEVLILAGKNMVFQNLSDQDNIQFFTNSETSDSVLMSMHEKVQNSVDYFNQSFGIYDPIDTFLVVLRNTPRKELGFQFARNNMIITGPEFDSYGNLSHEIAHYWWNKADFIQEPWLNESFANYGMFQVMEKYNPASFQKLYKKYQEISQDAPPVSTATLFSENAYNSYYIKGSVLLKQLESNIGKEKMNQLLQEIQQNGIHTTSGFLAELENMEGKKERQEFENLMSQ